jgi:hypothetical protein
MAPNGRVIDAILTSQLAEGNTVVDGTYQRCHLGRQ